MEIDIGTSFAFSARRSAVTVTGASTPATGGAAVSWACADSAASARTTEAVQRVNANGAGAAISRTGEWASWWGMEYIRVGGG